ncbi:MAG: hypothetical protein WD042_02290 [Phycisphaeraceae bacterium]
MKQLLQLLLTTMVLMQAAPTWAAAPSANAGRMGQYKVETGVAGYSYQVFAPKSYRPGAAAGIHLFFHGEGGANSAGNFGSWRRHFLEPYGLIGINMAYADGKNMHDTPGKVAAARMAVAQVMADYHVTAGRGAVGSHSGGGVPHGLWFSEAGQAGAEAWPFSHQALYGSNFWQRIRAGGRNTYLIALGTGEWGMGAPNLGISLVERAQELFKGVGQNTCPDVYLKITGRGHSIGDGDVRAAGASFRRWDLAYNAIVYEAHFAHPKLRPIAQQTNRLQLAAALRALDQLAKPAEGQENPLDADGRAQADLLRQLIDERAAAVLAMAQRLAEDDPALFDFYSPRYAEQLKGLAQEKEMAQLTADLRKSGRVAKALAAQRAFLSIVSRLFTPKAVSILATDVPSFRKLQEDLGPKSVYGQMIEEFIKASGVEAAAGK